MKNHETLFGLAWWALALLAVAVLIVYGGHKSHSGPTYPPYPCGQHNDCP